MLSLLLILSGSRESNPDHTVPNRVHYHYATPRLVQLVQFKLQTP